MTTLTPEEAFLSGSQALGPPSFWISKGRPMASTAPMEAGAVRQTWG